MDEDPDGEPGDTVMVSKGKMKRIGGMKEYEEMVARRLARRKDLYGFVSWVANEL